MVSTARRSIGTSTLVRNAPLSVQNRTDLPDTLNSRKQTVLHLFLDATLKIFACLRVSTRSQDLANQKLAILEFSQKHRHGHDDGFQEGAVRTIANLGPRGADKISTPSTGTTPSSSWTKPSVLNALRHQRFAHTLDLRHMRWRTQCSTGKPELRPAAHPQGGVARGLLMQDAWTRRPEGFSSLLTDPQICANTVPRTTEYSRSHYETIQ